MLVRQNREISTAQLRFGLDIFQYASSSSSFLAQNFAVLFRRGYVSTT